MTQEQKYLLVELLLIERRRLRSLKVTYRDNEAEECKILEEIQLCTKTLKTLMRGVDNAIIRS